MKKYEIANTVQEMGVCVSSYITIGVYVENIA